MCDGEKILYCNERDGENAGRVIRNLVILNGEFSMETPYQIGRNKRLDILSVVIISGAYCSLLIFLLVRSGPFVDSSFAKQIATCGKKNCKFRPHTALRYTKKRKKAVVYKWLRAKSGSSCRVDR